MLNVLGVLPACKPEGLKPADAAIVSMPEQGKGGKVLNPERRGQVNFMADIWERILQRPFKLRLSYQSGQRRAMLHCSSNDGNVVRR